MSESDSSSVESDEGSEGLGLQDYQFEPTISMPPENWLSDEEVSESKIEQRNIVWYVQTS